MRILQLYTGGYLKNFSYLVADNGEAAIIDPGCCSLFNRTRFSRIKKYIEEKSLSLKYIINTHRHFDHRNGNKYFSGISGIRTVSYSSGLREGNSLTIGTANFDIIETPGHTRDSICLYTGNHLFTGDCLFVGDSGATIFKDSNRSDQGASIRKLISSLPPETIVWPGHDYGNTKTSTLARERKTNKNSEEYKLLSVHYNGNNND